jgi:hypothetical protein
MSRISIRSMMLLIVLCALLLWLFAWLHAEAFFFVTGPLLGATLAAFSYRRDPSALITGGAVGGICQGFFAVLVLKRGYIFPDIAMMTGDRFLATLAVHLLAGLAFGMLLHLAFRWARPQPVRDMPEPKS